MMIPISAFFFQRLQNIFSDIYLRVLSSTGPYQALAQAIQMLFLFLLRIIMLVEHNYHISIPQWR